MVITHIESLYEPGKTLSLEQAQVRFSRGQGKAESAQFLTFGIGSAPVWIRLSLYNPSEQVIERRLTAGVTWIEKLDVYLVQHQQPLGHWLSGDAQSPNDHFHPGIGLVYDLDLPYGKSEVYIRAATEDPLTLPLQLLSISEARQHDTLTHVFYGLLYGILLALIAYNLIFYFTFKSPIALTYCLYIGCFIVLNVGYSGFGFAWWYPGFPILQNYATLLFMVVHGVSGLFFAMAFLSLKQSMPTLYRFVVGYAGFGAAIIASVVVLQLQFFAAAFAFIYLSTTTVLMLIVGLISIKRVNNTRLYLIAVGASMLGVLITALSVWGVIPFTQAGYHAAEIGVLCEALLLASILAKKMKMKEKQRISATYLSAYDPLTNLYNRRSFLLKGNQLLNVAKQKQLPLSLVVIDIDHFKAVNDTYGHQTGDDVLSHISVVLKESVREKDLLARWGGEELVLMLPETTTAKSIRFAERLRASLEATPFYKDSEKILITASFGVASNEDTESLEQLINQADQYLYRAKQNGRNRVEAPEY
ncbi:MAG: GGDEF domain-containing protein [Alteromonadaceae bacterium]|nr:GGDEF domain-containing protein [Alteromonadaceae bacterium]